MANRKSAIAFQSTPEQEARLTAVLEKLRGTQGAVMPALQQAQKCAAQALAARGGQRSQII